MTSDPTDLAHDALGVEEANDIPWPLLLRQRVADRLEGSDRYPWFVLTAVLLGLFAVGSTVTILAISVPSIAADLGSDDSTISWVTTGPILAYAVFGPIAGKLADVKGLRRIYLASLGAAVVGAAMTAAAPTAGALVACRVLAAAAGAATGPASLAIINRVFPPGQRSQALGFWSMVAAGGPVIGALFGAPVVEAFGWRWIFIMQAPVMAVCWLLAASVLPSIPPLHDRDGSGSKIDVWGAVLLGLGAVSLLLAVNRGAVLGWATSAVVAGFVLAVVFVVAFVMVERHVPQPLIPLAYTRRRNFSVPVLTQACTNFAYMGAFAITPLLLQNELGYTATEATWLSIPRPLVFAIAGPIAGYLIMRVGERPAGVFGAAAIFLSMLGLATVGASDGAWVIVGALSLSGLGMGASSPAMSTAIANAVDDRDLGIAGATQQMVNQVGVAIGIQVMLAVQTAREASVGAVGAYSDAYLVGGAVALVGVVLATFVRSSTRAHTVPGAAAAPMAAAAAPRAGLSTATR